jgi:ABC-type transport system substrate-binding protein
MNLLKGLSLRLAFVVSLTVTVLVLGATAAVAAGPVPSGRVAIAWHVTISPSWFDPSTAPPQITPFGMLYAIHDALVRPYPGQKTGPSLADSWQESEDGLTYEFKLRPGLKFHNGDSLTTEDVKFSFERYAGAGAQTLKDHVREIEIVDPLVARFHLKAPWPDFMTFYGTTASAAGIIVPKNYLMQVGDDSTARINEAACLGFCPPAGVIVPRVMEYALQVEPMPYDLPKAKRLLDEAGYPNGLDAGDFAANPGFPTVAEALVNDLTAAGIRVRLRNMERAAFYADWGAKKLRGLFMVGAGNSGNAATRVESFVQSKGAYASGGYPDIDELYQQQAGERDPKKREALLYQIQQLTIDRVMYAPVMDLRALMAVGPRITKHTITDVWMSPFPSYEDMEIKG